MRLIIKNNYESLCEWLASYIIKKIVDFAPDRDKPFVLGLPTGSSPLGVYKNLINAYKEKRIFFSNIITFNMDEYLGLSPDHPQSYKRFMNDNFFSHIDIKMENTHVPNGMAADPEAECRSYEEAIKAAGGIELFLGGMGVNGHIAFNEPGSSLSSRTRVEVLDIKTRESNSRFFGNKIEDVPEKALTVGIGTLLDARELLIIASGSAKADALKAAVEGAVDPLCPLSCIQLHPKAILAMDEDAASKLDSSTIADSKAG